MWKMLFGDDENTAKPRASETRSISLDFDRLKPNGYCVSTLEDLSELPKFESTSRDWTIVAFDAPYRFLDSAKPRIKMRHSVL